MRSRLTPKQEAFVAEVRRLLIEGKEREADLLRQDEQDVADLVNVRASDDSRTPSNDS